MRISLGDKATLAGDSTPGTRRGDQMRIWQRRLAPRGIAVGAIAMGVLLAAGACSSSGGTSGSSASVINGAGSTFAAPMYQQWAGQYHASHHVQINYQAIGSG